MKRLAEILRKNREDILARGRRCVLDDPSVPEAIQQGYTLTSAMRELSHLRTCILDAIEGEADFESASSPRDGPTRRGWFVREAHRARVGSPTFKPRIFEPFQRGDAQHGSAQGGIGLGLFIASEMVRAHRGRRSS